MKAGIIEYDKYLHPQGSSLYQGSVSPKVVAWEFGIMQGIQSKKVKASTGQFKNLSGTLSGNVINTGTFNTSLFQNGTVANSVVSGATISQPSITGGTLTNPTINTGTFNTSLMTGTLNNGVLGTPQLTNGTLGTALIQGGTFNNGVIGTPSVTGGTLNPGVYQTSGTAGATGSIVYVKTVSPGTTFGTVNFTNGLILSFN